MRKFLIEQILMDENLASGGAMTIEDVEREAKRGIHTIEYKKIVKERIARGQYNMNEVKKEYKVTKDPSIYDADGMMFAGKSQSYNNRAEYESKHSLVTLYDINAGTFKTFKRAGIISFDGTPVHDTRI
jgi:hypothetical protein